MDALMLRFSRFFIKHRLVNLVLIGGATLFFAYHALQLQVFSQFIDLLPRNHPFIQIYEKYNRQFGSANVVIAAIVAKEGSIYDERILEKVYAFTDQIDKIEGVDHGQVASMTAVTVRDTGIDQSGVISSTQVVGEEPLALLEAQFFTRRTVQRAEKRGETPPRRSRRVRRVREEAQGRARAAARVRLGAHQGRGHGRREEAGRAHRGPARERRARVPAAPPRRAARHLQARRRRT